MLRCLLAFLYPCHPIIPAGIEYPWNSASIKGWHPTSQAMGHAINGAVLQDLIPWIHQTLPPKR
jgi:hypothetical protein